MNASTNSKNFEYIVDSSKEFDGVCLDYLINGKSSTHGLTLDELIVKHDNPNLTAVSEETFIVNYLDLL